MIYLCRITFKRVIKKRSTEDFSCIPYIIALLNCLLFTWYGLPVVSNKWENFPLVTVNGAGILFELSYVLIYLWFSSPKGKASSNLFKLHTLFYCNNCIFGFYQIKSNVVLYFFIPNVSKTKGWKPKEHQWYMHASLYYIKFLPTTKGIVINLY